ncbi:MAG TPA: DoxX family protein [Pseudonocardiaceae bacterium]|jgi:putative oxidoreductase|nr:DoxX family protein [Pseudonocardiaceae bacterium]
MNAGLLVLRLVILVIMGMHGTQKLFGWWDGGGLAEAERFFTEAGFRPPRVMALVAGLTQTAGALLVGVGSVLGVAVLTGVLTTIVALHLPNGLDGRKQGCEYELMILAGVVTIGLAGPGQWSADQWLAVPPSGWIGATAIVVGLVAGLAVMGSRARQGVVNPT